MQLSLKIQMKLHETHLGKNLKTELSFAFSFFVVYCSFLRTNLGNKIFKNSNLEPESIYL